MIQDWSGEEVFEFGKYAGMKWREVPDSYVRWKIRKGQEDVEKGESELHRREEEQEREDALKMANMGELEREIHLWFRERVKKCHLDAGGSHEQMLKVNYLRDCWLALLSRHGRASD